MKKKTIILICSLILLLVLIYNFRNTSFTDKRSKLFSTSKEEIFMISLSNTEDSLFIKKNANTNEWESLFPISREINKQSIDFFFSSVLSVEKFKRVLTTDPRKFFYFRVTQETGSRIIFFNSKGEVLDDFYFGISDLLNYGSARKASELVVYEIDENIFNTITPSFSFWRNNSIINFELSNVDSIIVNQKENDYIIKNFQNQWIYQNKTESFPVNSLHRAFALLVNQLAQMKTYSFVDDLWPEYENYFRNPLLEMSIYYKDSAIDNLIITKFDDSRILIKVNDNKDTLFIGTWSMYNRFSAKPKDFKEVYQYSL